MRIDKVLFKFILSYLLMGICSATVIHHPQSVEFFASNNTQIIHLETAYKRLRSPEQQVLQSKIIAVLQKNHVEQGEFADVLGLSVMLNKNITADNAERFSSSPYQCLSNQKIYSIAKNLAIALKQESVAVFIPDQKSLGNVTVSFISYKPGVKELISLIEKKLSPIHSQAFSLYIVNDCNDLANAKVAAIEWLGSKIEFKEIKKLFRKEKIDFRFGKSYLVYQNGNRKEI